MGGGIRRESQQSRRVATGRWYWQSHLITLITYDVMVFIFLQNWRKWSIIVHSESRVATGRWYWQSYLMTFDNSCLMTLIRGDDIGQQLLPLAGEIDNHAWWCLITLYLTWCHWSVVMTVIMPYTDDDVQNLPYVISKSFLYMCCPHPTTEAPDL